MLPTHKVYLRAFKMQNVPKRWEKSITLFFTVYMEGKGHVWGADEDFAVSAPFLSVPGCRLSVSAPFGARLVFLKSFTKFNPIICKKKTLNK